MSKTKASTPTETPPTSGPTPSAAPIGTAGEATRPGAPGPDQPTRAPTGVTSSGEIHPSLTGTDAPTEIHRADDPSTARDVALSPDAARAAAGTMTTGVDVGIERDERGREIVTPQSQARAAALMRAAGSPVGADAPGVFSGGSVTRDGAGIPNSPQFQIGSPTFTPPALTSEEAELADGKPHLQFVNGQLLNPPADKRTAPDDPRLQAAAKEGLRTSLETFIRETGRNASQLGTSLDRYVREISPEFNRQVVAAIGGDPVAQYNVGYLRDTAAGKAGILADDFADEERAALSAVVVAIVPAVAALLKA